MPRRSRPDRPARIPRQPRHEQPPHEVLGLSAREADAVRVIEVAHFLLRRWRQVSSNGQVAGLPGVETEASNRIQEILRARQAMLERIHAGWRCP